MVVWGGFINSWGKREEKGKGERERYIQLNAKFQRIARRGKKAFLNEQCKEIRKNNRMRKCRDFFKKIGDIKETLHARMNMIKDRNGKDLTEAEEIKKRWQEHIEELYKKKGEQQQSFFINLHSGLPLLYSFLKMERCFQTECMVCLGLMLCHLKEKPPLHLYSVWVWERRWSCSEIKSVSFIPIQSLGSITISRNTSLPLYLSPCFWYSELIFI